MKRDTQSKRMLILMVLAVFMMNAPLIADQPAVDTSQVHTVVDVMPVLIGGLDMLYATMDVPESVMNGYLEGRVFLKFVVDEKGRVIQSRILKDIGDDCGEIAIRSIKRMAFIPGMINGTPVKVSFTMPVLFDARHFRRVSTP